jgi:hypothetical protein
VVIWHFPPTFWYVVPRKIWQPWFVRHDFDVRTSIHGKISMFVPDGDDDDDDDGDDDLDLGRVARLVLAQASRAKLQKCSQGPML